MAIHVVSQGENVDRIAEEYGISVQNLTYVNQIAYPYALAVGQAIFIPDMDVGEKRQIRTNGYAYPFIRENVLAESLPFLTNLSVFSYGFTEEGELIPPAQSVDFMLQTAYDMDTIPILTLTPFGADGKFNNNLIHQLLLQEESIDNLISSVIAECVKMGYGGVDVDFEYILAEDRVPFAEFVARLTTDCNEQGLETSVALAPKTSAEQKGLLYEGKDYRLLGQAANRVLLMTYEWGYSRGPAMAVAPINKVEQVVAYAVTEIPVEKIHMGIPNYGYDWTLPYVRGTSVARTIGNLEAVDIAIQQGVEIQYDEVAQSPFFRYTNEGEEHEVWFEDVRSLSAKFDLLNQYGLAGVGYWQIMRLFRPGWYLLNSYFFIQKG